MTWDKDDYPAAMKNLPTSVRNKAISIANSLIAENSPKFQSSIKQRSFKAFRRVSDTFLFSIWS